MIDRLIIRNFQPHKKLDISFDPKVTTIIGASDSGKSSIIRALLWILTNKPSGDSFIHDGEDFVTVKLYLDTLLKIIRTKGKGVNTYKIIKEEKEEKFEAFGNDVPEIISKVLNVSEINYQSQHSSPFWFSETAGEVSRQLNSIVNLDVIDKTLTNIMSFLRKAQSTKELIEERLGELTERKNQSQYVKEINEELKRVEKFQGQLGKIAVECSTIDELLARGIKHRINKENAAQVNVEGRKALLIGEKHRELAKKSQTLDNLLETGLTCKRVLDTKLLSIQPLKKQVDSINSLYDLIHVLGDKIQKIDELYNRKIETSKKLKKLQSEFERILGERCPLCGNLMKKK